MRNVMLYDVAAIKWASRDVFAVFGHVQKPGCNARDCIARYNHRTTSCDIA